MRTSERIDHDREARHVCNRELSWQRRDARRCTYHELYPGMGAGAGDHHVGGRGRAPYLPLRPAEPPRRAYDDLSTRAGLERLSVLRVEQPVRRVFWGCCTADERPAELC